MEILSANIVKRYTRGLIKKINIFEVKFKVNVSEGETVVILGRNGSGKTTIIKTLCLLLYPDEGEIIFKSKNILGQKKLEELYKKSVGYVPSRAYLSFDPTYSVINSMTEVLKISPTEIVFEITKILEKVGMKKEIIYKYPSELSGGELQLLSLCRAILRKPQIIFMDEPTSYLDSVSQKEFFEILQTIRKENNMAIVMTIHNINLAKKLADKVITLDNKS